METKRLIVVTDGDQSAYRLASKVCRELGLDLIDATAGNPTTASIVAVEEAIAASPRSEVVVLVDDAGLHGAGNGETMLGMLASSPVGQIVAAVAVASHALDDGEVSVDEAVTVSGLVVESAVDKEGHPVSGRTLNGDTVGALERLGVPLVGLGDFGFGKGRSGEAALRTALQEARHLARGEAVRPRRRAVGPRPARRG